jgi:ribose 5-phosphate isomerase B
MKIALASDHAGYRYKLLLSDWLSFHGYEVVDFGTDSEAPVDYPDYVRPAAEAVARGDCDAGVVFGGSGNGEAMAANRVRGARCAVCWNEETGRLAKMHNNANLISIGQRLISEESLYKIVAAWLCAQFEAGRHVARIEKLDQ